MTLINMLIMILEDHKQRTKLTCTQSSKEETVYGLFMFVTQQQKINAA